MESEVEENRLVLVTGGGRGIGEAICKQLARSGLRVVVADIDGESAHRVANQLGARHIAKVLDVSDEAAVVQLFNELEAAHGPVAALVCVAGVLILPEGKRPFIKNMTLENWERSFAVNARGAFLCSREYLRHREAKPVPQGRVVFFGSVAAQLGGYRSSAAYIGAKSAVHGYAKAFAREASHLGITANTIAPGMIDTDMLRSTVSSGGDLIAAAKNIPMGRIGTVDDVASAVSYLMSPAADYITGNVIDVNGGYRMQ